MTSPAAKLADVTARAQNAESLISSASTKKGVLDNAIHAAELYMEALHLTDDTHEKRQLKAKCQMLLKHAEQTKKAQEAEQGRSAVGNALTGRITPPEDAKPIHPLLSNRKLSTREKIILLEGSKLNGFTFPPWESPPNPREFQLGHDQELYIELPDLRLSDLQLKVFNGWKRPDDVLPPPLSSLPKQAGGEDGVTMISRDVVDLVQDVTTDCSVVASLCAGTARAERGRSKILSTIAYPYDHEIGTPARSPNGKYVFRLNFNGCFRKVVIDDRLPASRSDRVLHVIDRNNPGLLWPALLEKAYLKVRGGYDFPGSNSGTDIWVLTGWIPEQIFLKSAETMPSQLWRRVYKAFHDGNALLTIGTGRLTRREQAGLGLAGEHDYAVLNMKETGEHRLLLVKNPWSQGTIWKGQLPSSSSVEWEGESQARQAQTKNSETSPPATEKLNPGTFWIDLDSVMQSFESFYLNWNPNLFRHREDAHFSWDLGVGSGSAGCFVRNPQYALYSKARGPVWVLLDRHFRTEEDSEARELSGPPSTHKGKLGFISLYIFDRGRQRVFLSDGALHRGNYVDSPQTLLSLDLPEGSNYTVVVSQQSLPPALYSFTLSAFSLHPITLEPAKERYNHTITYQSAWTMATAGGNATSPSYPINPQFSLSSCARTDLALMLETSSEELSVNVKLVWGGGKRVSKVLTRDIVGQSGEYRRGCALAEMRDIEAGVYTIICSTFEPRQLGDFTLRASSVVECQMRPIPAEGAGRLSLRLPPAIFPRGLNRVLAPVMYEQVTRLFIVARYPEASTMTTTSTSTSTSTSSSNYTADTSPPPRSPLKISLELGQGPNKEIITVSHEGEYSDAPMGARTADVDVLADMRRKGGVWLVVERLAGIGTGAEEKIHVEVLSDARVEIGAWGVGEG
ncbi:MAG: cysteine protease [Sclerophora amabilis]|nr:MAG: cysteine protease [Sclerophora amabilis]